MTWANPPPSTGQRIDEGGAKRILKFQFQYEDNGQWKTVFEGGQIGNQIELKFEPVTAQVLRLNIPESADAPGIYEIQLFEVK